jgi:hypothetical protein
MVEVHLMTGEPPTAVGTRPLTQGPQELDGSDLASPDATDLNIAIRRVVGNVPGSLVASSEHA